MIRAPHITDLLRASGERTRIYILQGYLFFLNAQTILRQAAADVEATADFRFLILDFRECVGLDSSALLVFRKIGQFAEQARFDVLLVNLGPIAHQQIERDGLLVEPRIRIFRTRDAAMRAAETALLSEAGTSDEGEATSFAQHLADRLGCTVGAGELEPYLSLRTLAAGEALMRQGEPADAFYFLEHGIISIRLEMPGRSNHRLRTTTAGTVIGEIGLAQGGRRTATAIAESPCRTVGIDRAALARMERERPDLALYVQRFLILELADKIVDTNRLLEAELS
ncbi:cyclic nucleotide-binding domain-containing protein [Methylobacterium sp.]|uniref:cyclic nucleotide-binding domain-containing protein n=1 Tax=Methylobacterium sp. TaxID=409 RepID=UPI003B02B45F